MSPPKKPPPKNFTAKSNLLFCFFVHDNNMVFIIHYSIAS